jgi:hypothetical protein
VHALALAGLWATALTASIPNHVLAEDSVPYDAIPPYVVEVNDVTAKVGEHVVMLATLKLKDGYRVLEAYNNRVGQFSSFDDGVRFEQKVVGATVQERTLIFPVALQATKPGKHPINGVIRVGYIKGPDTMWMVSVPLIANVTGTE